jgi:hypothetical protein
MLLTAKVKRAAGCSLHVRTGMYFNLTYLLWAGVQLELGDTP